MAEKSERHLPRWVPQSIVSWTILYSIVFGVGLASAAIWVAYSTSRDVIQTSALRSVGATATARKTDLLRALSRQRDRSSNVLRLADESCNIGGVADEACLRKIARDFISAERAAGVHLLSGGRDIFIGQSAPSDRTVIPRDDEVARFERDAHGAYYTIAVREADRYIAVRFPAQSIEPIFAESSGLGRSGETFLADANGYFITRPRFHAASGNSHPIDAMPMQTCLAGMNGEMIAADYRGVDVIHGFRAVPEIGGGCVMAHMNRAEALQPALALRRRMMTASLMVLIPALLAGIFAVRLLTRPLQRITRAAQAVGAGDYDTVIDVRGSREIRVLGSTIASLAKSVRDSLARERELRIEAEEANRAKDQFLATVSHELRTPMTAIIGWAKMLELHADDPETRSAAVDAIQRSSSVQAELIDDLLDASRIATGKLRLDLRPLDLNRIISEIAENFRPTAAAKRIELSVNLPERSVIVAGDESRLAQVINNLLTNAVKFTPEGGRIDITLECSRREATITVKDTGVGIEPTLLTSIFEPFRQQDSSATRRHGGLGLGLAIVRQLVDMHGGRVSAESAGPGKGATMRVTLPAIDASAANDPLEDDHGFSRLDGRRVLIVDDEQEIATLVSTILRSSGATTECATSARDALERIRSGEPFDAIVSDIAMPEEDGLSFIRRLRDEKIDTPAIALTALGALGDEQRALAAGFDAFLRKPIDPARLTRAVCAAASRRHSD